jgi:TPR repeat protein
MESQTFALFENDIKNQKTSRFLRQFLSLIQQDDRSHMNFSVFQFLLNLSSNHPDFCLSFAQFLQNKLKLHDSIIEYLCEICFIAGFGVTISFCQATFYFTQSSQQQYPRAVYSLAICYENGNGVEKNQKKAIELYQKAIEFNSPDSMINLAICYENGDGVSKNQNKAIKLY